MGFIEDLEKVFAEKSNLKNAIAMAKYMRNHFSFFGIKTDERRRIFKKICEENKQEIEDKPREIALKLYSKKQRELHYCAIEILKKQLKGNYKKEDIQLIEKLIVTNSWWDSVDTIAKNILGEYLLEYPLETEKVIERFSNFENMWLTRSVLLFQLGYKQKTNFDLLKSGCEKHKNSNEFFIQKAIGWSLREYGKTNPEAVRNFANQTNLKPLSKKEALKNIS
ncbi:MULTISPECIES: DNA alkylation repair protein [unclassified Flavobacterium]|jgi:3-methyladenine DNA glycosylase AlkD|uniref:DNA alkylation repair protein n=1 Tax=unclassified Flavobacterium TaxID=196869 RepID=UPI0025C4C211|nr:MULTISPECIES: DNA alkylation repair protein [unclassified Flavobacterium]